MDLDSAYLLLAVLTDFTRRLIIANTGNSWIVGRKR
jgi:hypothetical protein